MYPKFCPKYPFIFTDKAFSILEAEDRACENNQPHRDATSHKTNIITSYFVKHNRQLALKIYFTVQITVQTGID